MSAKAKLPGSIVQDLRQYAASLNLPKDWHERVGHTQQPMPLGSRWVFRYESQLLATYDLDILSEIQSAERHIPIPPPINPLVVASELATSQPADTKWRRFKHLTFRREEIVAVNNVDEKGIENGVSFVMLFRNGEKMICGNEKNYANSGMSTCEFFLQHVLELTPPKIT